MGHLHILLNDAASSFNKTQKKKKQIKKVVIKLMVCLTLAINFQRVVAVLLLSSKMMLQSLQKYRP